VYAVAADAIRLDVSVTALQPAHISVPERGARRLRVS